MTVSAKNIEQKIDRMLNTWQTLAPGKSFGGMTLAQFEAAAQQSKEARQRIDDLEGQRTQAITDREAADDAFQTRKPNSSSTASLQTRPKAPTAPSTKPSAIRARANAAAV